MRSLIIALGLLSLISVQAAASSPLGKSTWARPIGLGNAFIGLADGPACLFTNAAGLSEIERLNLLSSYSRASEDVSFTSIGAVFPNQLSGSLGVAYRNRIISGVPVSAETLDFFDHDLLLSYARQLRANWSLGADLRYLASGPSKNLSLAKSGNGWALGLSTKYHYAPWLSFGAAVQDLGLKLTYNDGTTDDYPANFVLGSSCQLAKQNLILNLDLNKEGGDPLLWHFGAEWSPLPLFAFRLGLDQTAKNRTEAYNNLTLGLGIKNAGITFDYAFYKNDSAALSNTHYFSVGYIGEDKPVFSSSEASKYLLKHFSDVPEGYWAKTAIEQTTALGLINSYSDGTFRPEQPISRAETVVLLVRAKDYPPPKEEQQVFPDVPTSFWAATAIQTAKANDLARGYPDGGFKPRNNTTRAEGVTFLTRFDNLTLRSVSTPPFADLPKHHWALREILAAKESHWLEYLKTETFTPAQSLTRAELAEVLSRTGFTQEKIKGALFSE